MGVALRHKERAAIGSKLRSRTGILASSAVLTRIYGKGDVDVTRFIAALVAVLMLASTVALAAGFIVNPDLLDKIKPGMTSQEVEQILGPPRSRSDFSRLGVVSMDYETRIWTDTYDIGVMIGKDGIVREVQRIMRYRGAAGF
jgi:hypothetical protein